VSSQELVTAVEGFMELGLAGEVGNVLEYT
jgi:hypothetical protein